MYKLSTEFQHQLLCALPVIFNEFIMGLGYGWVAPTLRVIQDNPSEELSLTIEESSWIASLHEFGRFFGPLISTSLLNRIGRKGTLMTCSVTFFLTFLLIALTKSVSAIYCARMAFGIAVGINDVTSSIYICENFKPSNRGVFGSIAIAAFYGGFLVEICWVDFLTYEVVAYINLVVTFLTLSNIFLLTEPAQYLISKGNYEKAFKNFLWLQGKSDSTSADANDEFDRLKQHIVDEQKDGRSIRALLSTPIYRKSISIVLIFCILLVATGFSAVTSFASIAFSEGVLTPNEYMILFGLLQFASSVLASTIIEKVNRRTILMVSFLIAMGAHVSTALLFYLQNRIFIPYFSWWIFAAITLYAMTYSTGILTIFYTTRGELLPQNARPLGGSIAIMGHSLVGFFTTKVFLFVAEVCGVYWNFAFYSLMSLASALFVYFILPETRGKSLLEIQTAIQMSKIE